MAEEAKGVIVANVICIEYTVQKGDVLGALAAKYKTTVAVIAAINKIADPNRILVGQKLYLPCPTAKV